MHVLAISYGRNLFNASNPERARMKACALVVESLHIIVFARSKENFIPVTDGNLCIYPTGGSTKLSMVVRGFFLGRKLLQQHQFKNVVITTQDPFEAGLVGYLLATLFRVPLNIQEHGDFFSTSFWRKESLLNTLRYPLGLFLLRHATTVRVVSKRIKNTLLQKGIKEDVIRELSVAVPVNKFLQAAPATIARDLFESGTIVILSMARFVPQKNLSLLITAFANAYTQEPTLRLLLIGEGPDTAKLIQLIDTVLPQNHSKQIIKIIPWTDDVPAYMKSVDIYALSSNYEGYARVLPEAMASGLPIVTTDVGCVGEVCINNEHAVVVPINEINEFAKALLLVAKNPELQKRFSEASIKRMKARASTPLDYPIMWLNAL